MRREVELVVISDVHLGTYGSRAEELVKYLRSIKPKTLVLNGDIIDIDAKKGSINVRLSKKELRERDRLREQREKEKVVLLPWYCLHSIPYKKAPCQLGFYG